MNFTISINLTAAQRNKLIELAAKHGFKRVDDTVNVSDNEANQMYRFALKKIIREALP